MSQNNSDAADIIFSLIAFVAVSFVCVIALKGCHMNQMELCYKQTQDHKCWELK